MNLTEQRSPGPEIVALRHGQTRNGHARMAAFAPFTVIIPAHNEEAVIGRCLSCLLEDAPSQSELQVIVAANGCSDRTAELARRYGNPVEVLELAEGSKTKAMNAGNSVARHFPRIYLDADVQCAFPSLAALAETLRQPGVMAASPSLKMDLSRSDFFVRAYYRVWLTQPYVTDAMVGSGCFGLSQAAYARIGDFPEITGDDIWVHSRFPADERRNVASHEGEPVFFLVSPPLRVTDQIRVETRRRLGNEQVLREHPSQAYAGSNKPSDLRKALKNGASVLDVLIYLGVKTLVRLRTRQARRTSKHIKWERDLAARET